MRKEIETVKQIIKIKNIKKNIYLDIGSCTGELSFPFHNNFKKIYSFEPNVLATKIFKYNNIYKNIVLIEKALSNYSGKIRFGGFGYGDHNDPPRLDNINEMHTTLVSDEKFLIEELSNPMKYDLPDHRSGPISYVDCISFQNFLDEYGILCEDISLIKMDIEGGEKFVIPDMIDKLNRYKIPLCLELHTHVLKSNECITILEYLFKAYRSIFEITKPVTIVSPAGEKIVMCNELKICKLETLKNKIRKGNPTIKVFCH